MNSNQQPTASYIYSYPAEKVYEFGHEYDVTRDNLAIGDLHGNSIKLLHLLIRYGVVDIIDEPGSDDESNATQSTESTFTAQVDDGSSVIDHYDDSTEVDSADERQQRKNQTFTTLYHCYLILHFLLKQDMSTLTDPDYSIAQGLKDTYGDDFFITNEQPVWEVFSDVVEVIDGIMNTKLKFNPNPCFFQLSGDIFGERSPSDRLTGNFFKLIAMANLKYNALVGNHDCSFILTLLRLFKPYTKKEKTLEEVMNPANITRMVSSDSTGSLDNLVKVFKLRLMQAQAAGDVDPEMSVEKEVKALVDNAEKYYFPMLRLVDYLYNPSIPRLTISVHAPNGIDSLGEIAAAVGVEFDETTLSVVSIITAIEAINDKLIGPVTGKLNEEVMNKVFNSYEYKLDYADDISQRIADFESAMATTQDDLQHRQEQLKKMIKEHHTNLALNKLVWHRVSNNNPKNKYNLNDMRSTIIEPNGRVVQLYYRHGHDMCKQHLKHILQLDNIVGKYEPDLEYQAHAKMGDARTNVGHIGVQAINCLFWKSKRNIEAKIETLEQQIGLQTVPVNMQLFGPISIPFPDQVKALKERILKEIPIPEFQQLLHDRLEAIELPRMDSTSGKSNTQTKSSDRSTTQESHEIAECPSSSQSVADKENHHNKMNRGEHGHRRWHSM